MPVNHDASFVDRLAPNVAQLFLDRVATSGGREAFRYPDGDGWTSLTWSEAGTLVSRYAATFAFYREQLPAAAARLRGYLGSASSAAILDEPATAQAMASVLVRGLQCGALDEDEVAGRVGADSARLLELYRRRVG